MEFREPTEQDVRELIGMLEAVRRSSLRSWLLNAALLWFNAFMFVLYLFQHDYTGLIHVPLCVLAYHYGHGALGDLLRSRRDLRVMREYLDHFAERKEVKQ